MVTHQNRGRALWAPARKFSINGTAFRRFSQSPRMPGSGRPPTLAHCPGADKHPDIPGSRHSQGVLSTRSGHPSVSALGGRAWRVFSTDQLQAPQEDAARAIRTPLLSRIWPDTDWLLCPTRPENRRAIQLRMDARPLVTRRNRLHLVWSIDGKTRSDRRAGNVF